MAADSSPTPRPRKLVVAALIVQSDAERHGSDRGRAISSDGGADGPGRVLISQRREDQTLSLYWEFPGGKIEAGESPEVALRREIREELDVAIAVGRIWDVLFYAYPAYDVLMLVYPCRLELGHVPRAAEVKDLAWVEPKALAQYSILPADAPLVERLVREGVPQPVIETAPAPAVRPAV
jgi:8-oxo-dGTP diphosphatase